MKKNNRSLLLIMMVTFLFLWGLVALDTLTAFAKPTFGEKCEGCHNKSKQELLNSTKAVKPNTQPAAIKVKSPHTTSFFKTHGTEVVKKGVTSCNKCHQSTNFCSACHRKTVQPASWDQQHKEACSQCHAWVKAKK